ncbi:response regulator transcription factor [Chloroflexota bacterium]
MYITFNIVIMSRKVLVINNTISPTNNRQLLCDDGYRVDVVHNFDRHMHQVDTQAYDLIVLQESPETDKWQLCEMIRLLRHRSLIVICIHAGADTCAKAINAGADYFMRKPFGQLEFLARVHSLLQRTSIYQPATVGS